MYVLIDTIALKKTCILHTGVVFFFFFKPFTVIYFFPKRFRTNKKLMRIRMMTCETQVCIIRVPKINQFEILGRRKNSGNRW